MTKCYRQSEKRGGKWRKKQQQQQQQQQEGAVWRTDACSDWIVAADGRGDKRREGGGGGGWGGRTETGQKIEVHVT